MTLFLTKLASRKLAIAIAAIATAVANKQYDIAVGAAVAYILAQAHVDATTAKAGAKSVEKAAVAVEASVGDPRFQ